MRIVVIDDETETANALADALRFDGHAAMVAPSGHEGLSLIQAERPDVVFLDLVMPGLSGMEVLREVRRRDPHLPVIVVSGHATPQELEEARQLGVTHVMEKPWVLTYLAQALRAAGAGTGELGGPSRGPQGPAV
jgi:DNA-binding NtrC family response regulator